MRKRISPLTLIHANLISGIGIGLLFSLAANMVLGTGGLIVVGTVLGFAPMTYLSISRYLDRGN